MHGMFGLARQNITGMRGLKLVSRTTQQLKLWHTGNCTTGQGPCRLCSEERTQAGCHTQEVLQATCLQLEFNSSLQTFFELRLKLPATVALLWLALQFASTFMLYNTYCNCSTQLQPQYTATTTVQHQLPFP